MNYDTDKSFTAPDGHRGPLWPSIHAAMRASKHAYSASTAEARRKREWLFRGQANAQWPLIPSLHRPPNNSDILRRRMEYTSKFIEHFASYSPVVGVAKATEAQYRAVAQHYGFYTTLLDFTWNIDIAAYFATVGSRDYDVGVIYQYHAAEYEQMREMSLHFGKGQSASHLKKEGWGPMPPLLLHEFNDVPRIKNQEGVFIEASSEDSLTLMKQCIDRIYFEQQPGIVYKGQIQLRIDYLPDKEDFQSEEMYTEFSAQVESEHPELFEREPPITEGKLFPFDDPISSYTLFWKEFNLDPLRTEVSRNRRVQPGDDISLAGLLPSRLWLGVLANRFRFNADQACLIVLKETSFLASLIRSLRLLLFGEQPIIVGLDHYKASTLTIDFDRYIHETDSLSDELKKRDSRQYMVFIVIGAGSLTTVQTAFIRSVSRGNRRRERCPVVFVTSSSNIKDNPDLPSIFGPGNVTFLE